MVKEKSHRVPDQEARRVQHRTGTAGALGALSPAGAEVGALPCVCACRDAEESCGMGAAGAVTWGLAANAGASAIATVGACTKSIALLIAVDLMSSTRQRAARGGLATWLPYHVGATVSSSPARLLSLPKAVTEKCICPSLHMMAR